MFLEKDHPLPFPILPAFIRLPVTLALEHQKQTLEAGVEAGCEGLRVCPSDPRLLK